jgi:hypothetical protein
MPTPESSNPMKNDANKYCEKFLYSVWITKGCRFTANRRFAAKQQASMLSTSMLSIYIIAASLYCLLFGQQMNGYRCAVFNLITITASIFLLVLSHLESGKNYGVRASNMLRCAQKLSSLHNIIEYQISANSLTESSFRDYMSHYDRIMRDFSDNHSDIDFFQFKSGHRKKFKLDGFKNLPQIIFYKIAYFLDIWFIYGTIATVNS